MKNGSSYPGGLRSLGPQTHTTYNIVSYPTYEYMYAVLTTPILKHDTTSEKKVGPIWADVSGSHIFGIPYDARVSGDDGWMDGQKSL